MSNNVANVPLDRSTLDHVEGALTRDGTFSTAAALQFLRKRKGLSARALSVAAGLSPSYVSKVESGEVQPSLHAFSRLARELRMTQHEVLFIIAAEGGS